MLKFLVKTENGCGDHVAAIIEAESALQALQRAQSLKQWPDWTDVSVKQWFGPSDRPTWLIDFEDFCHEEPYNYDAKY